MQSTSCTKSLYSNSGAWYSLGSCRVTLYWFKYRSEEILFPFSDWNLHCNRRELWRWTCLQIEMYKLRQHISKENFATKQQTNKQTKIEYWKYIPSYKTSIENYGVAHIQSLDSIARDTNVVVDSIVCITAGVAQFILHLAVLKLENKSVVLLNLSIEDKWTLPFRLQHSNIIAWRKDWQIDQTRTVPAWELACFSMTCNISMLQYICLV